MIYADTAAEIEKRRKAFLRKWRLKCRAVADSLEEAGARLFTLASRADKGSGPASRRRGRRHRSRRSLPARCAVEHYRGEWRCRARPAVREPGSPAASGRRPAADGSGAPPAGPVTRKTSEARSASTGDRPPRETRLGIVAVGRRGNAPLAPVPVRLTVRLDVERHDLRRHQPHLVTRVGQHLRPVMRAAARLHPDRAGRQTGEERRHLLSPEPLAQHDPSRASTAWTSNTYLAGSRPSRTISIVVSFFAHRA